MTATIVFRADASPHIGGGHLLRCLTLARSMAERGWHCSFAVNRDAEHVVPALHQAGMEVLTLDCAARDEAEVMRTHWLQGVDWLVVDHYQRDIAMEHACRPWARHILVIDDLADRAHDCDLLLDQTLGRIPEAYAPHVEPHCQLLLGTDFALVRPQFKQARTQSLERHRTNNSVRRILISMGATDSLNITSRVMQPLLEAGLELDIVLSSAAPHLSAVQKIAAELSSQVHIHTNVENMAGLMMSADLAVGAAGTTSWERCCMGLPSVLVVTADNQCLIAKALQAAGAAHVCGWHEALSPDDIVVAALRLGREHTARVRMSMLAAQICDGLGTERVAEQLAA